jgi:hypothetical protein
LDAANGDAMERRTSGVAQTQRLLRLLALSRWYFRSRVVCMPFVVVSFALFFSLLVDLANQKSRRKVF